MVDKEVLVPEPAFNIPTVREELYRKTLEALVQQGLTFVVAIRPLSIGQLARGKETGSLFGHINPSKKMRSNIPPQIEVAIDPKHLKIEGSNSKSTDIQIGRIKEREAVLKSKLPKEVGDLISMIIPEYASILAQLDFEHQKRTGKALFTDWYGRTDEQTVPGKVARVGRLGSIGSLMLFKPPEGLEVRGLDRDGCDSRLFAFPVVVLPRKLAV